MCQHTVADTIEVSGKGLLLGVDATIRFQPAPVGHGVVFERQDLKKAIRIPATANHVARRARRTTLKLGNATVETVEHCMSALAGVGVDNVNIEINGPELPCGDGSAAPFVDAIMKVGLASQDADRNVYRIAEPIVIEDGDAMIACFPTQRDALELVYDLDYGSSSNRIRRQAQAYSSLNGDYLHEIARARTFSLEEEAQALWEKGMCRHLTPKDVLVIGDNGPIDNAYRYENEPVRHKIVDLIGDLYLVGYPVYGRFVAYRSGHELNRRMALAIMRQREHVERKHALLHGREMDIHTIQRILPHRFPMLLVDRVVSIDGDRKAIGVKNVSINEPFFQGHYPGTPIMPGVLIVEAMGQLGGLLMSQKLEHTGKIAVLLSLDKVKLRQPVTPGDQLILEAEAIRTRPRTGTMRCRAFVGDKIAAEAQIRFMMVDADRD
jgi:UDP-3-O-[3-hydroxymyristoyl] N-acetylglucosamine deacetylase/3-hydroxyacyl-[acyl-carrier-protein] dehydratase